MNATRRHSLSFKHRLEIAEFLKSVIIVSEAGPFCYKDGWSDAIVATRLKCTKANVYGIRTELYPNFVDKYKVKSKDDDLAAKVADLEKRLAYLERELGVTPK